MKIPVQIELSLTVYGKLQRIAESKGITVEELIVQIVEEYLDDGKMDN